MVGSSKIKKLDGVFARIQSFTLDCSPPLKEDTFYNTFLAVIPKCESPFLASLTVNTGNLFKTTSRAVKVGSSQVSSCEKYAIFT